MATLEVHDGQGRVQFVELGRDHPVLFGTSAACDVLLDGEGIRPVHGRIRWKKRRFRVEASPDAEYVLDQRHQDDRRRASTRVTRSRSAVAGSSCCATMKTWTMRPRGRRPRPTKEERRC